MHQYLKDFLYLYVPPLPFFPKGICMGFFSIALPIYQSAITNTKYLQQQKFFLPYLINDLWQAVTVNQYTHVNSPV